MKKWFSNRFQKTRRVLSQTGPSSARLPRKWRPVFDHLEDRTLPTVTLTGVPDWVSQGPSPALEGQVEHLPSTDGDPDHNYQVVGAIQVIAVNPTNPNIVFAGGVNGGVWRTTNYGVLSPTWTPLTDQFSSLSIGALEFDPLDATQNTLVAGIGKFSSFGVGNPGFGILRTTDGGNSWSVVPGNAQLAGTSISAVAERGATIVVASNTASPGGLLRSTDSGGSFTVISGTNGLAAGGASDLAGDPTNNARLYASIAGVGLFRSNDNGLNWTNVSAGDAALNTAFTGGKFTNARIAVSPVNGRAWIIVARDGEASYIGFSDNQGDTWTQMDLPITQEYKDGPFFGINPGGQASTNLTITADPANVNLVYVGGDTQPAGKDQNWPNSLGAFDYSGRLFRGNSAVAPVDPGSTKNAFSPQWASLTNRADAGFVGTSSGTNNNSSPHADERNLVFDLSGNLVAGCDGGLYVRTNPRDNTGQWFSKMGDGAGGLQVTEMHDIAWDNNSHIIISGNQDTGTTEQLSTGSTIWRSVLTSDGGDVAVDNNIGGGLSLRYSSFPELAGFQGQVVNTANMVVNTVFPKLNPGADPPLQTRFLTPIAVDAVAADRLIIGGTNGTYESLNRGDNIVRIDTSFINYNAIASGGRMGAVANPDVLYIGSGNTVRNRFGPGGLNATSPLPAGANSITAIGLDPDNFMTAYVVDADQVFQTTDGGASWTDITGNLVNNSLKTVVVINGPGGGPDAVLVGGLGGVFRMNSANPGVWTEYGNNLPRTFVYDLDYDASDDILVAGTLGRGAFTVANASATAFQGGILTICGDMDFPNENDTIALVRNAANPTLLNVTVNGTMFGPFELGAIQQINVWGAGGNDTLIVDSSNGLITVPAGIFYDGDHPCPGQAGAGLGGFDTLTLQQTGGPTQTSETYDVGLIAGTGTDTIVAAGTQTVFFQGLEPIKSAVPAVTLTINATPADNAINYTQGPGSVSAPFFGATTGQVTIDGESIEFANKTNPTVNGLAGGDSFNLNNPTTPTGLTGVSTVNGGAGGDSFTVNTTGTVPITLDGQDGDDTYIVNFASAFGPIAATVNLADSGVFDSDLAIINGTPAEDTFNITEAQTTLVGAQTVTYTSTIKQLRVNGLGGNDTFNVSPSRFADILLDGGSPSFGQAGTPPDVDTLNFNPLGNTFTLVGKTLFTNGGTPPFHGVTFHDMEALPIAPLGSSTLAFDFNGTASSPTQAGYSGVLPTRLYGGGNPGADYGWLTTLPAGGFDRGPGSTSPFASLLQDGQFAGTGAAGARTFRADVGNGYYLVSVKMGDLSFAKDQMRVTNADTGQTVLDNLSSPAGRVLETNFVINVTDGTMDLTFSDQGGPDLFWTLNGLDIRPAVLLTEGFAPQGPFTADGVTVDTFTAVGVTPGAEVTVSTNLGTITSPDVDPSVVGIQLMADGMGQASVSILRPTGGGMALMLFEEVSGAQTGCGLVTYALQDTRRFDFNAPGSPTQLPSAPPTVGGYLGVLPTDTYTAARGFGWLTAAAAFDRGPLSGTTRSDLLRDGAWAGAFGSKDFRIDLPPGGPFQVTVTMGDATFTRDQMSVSVITGTGTGLSGITTAAGQFFNGSFTVSPSGGAVVLRFADGGGSDPYWVLNALEVRPVAAVASILVTGPGGSLQADGMTTDTFAVTAPVGTLVTLSTDKGTVTGVSDADAHYAGVQAISKGVPIAFGILRPTSAGLATVTAADVTGASRGTFAQGYVVAATRRFDFNAGSAASATAPGFLGVLGADTYTAARGYGWNAAVPEFDRGTASPTTVALYRDGHYGKAGAVGARTFRIQVNPGVYNLRVYVGDAGFGRDNIRVSAEGGAGLIVVPNTAPNSFVSVTFTGQDVNADGVLDVTIQDLGGDPYWVVNGLDIASGALPGAAPQLAAGGAVSGRPGVAALTADQLQAIVSAAIARWAAAGLDAARLATLQQVQFQIGDFGGSGVLGLTALGGMVVTLDATAAGHGWFVDPTPGDDSEFALAGGLEGRAVAGSVASGRMDLLTVVEHELGHVLGLDDLSASSGDVMDVALAEGVRRLPGAADVDAGFTAPPVPSSPPPAKASGLGVVATDTIHKAGRRLRHARGRHAPRTLRAHAAKALRPGGTKVH